jgi:hypothetical protein
MRLKAAIASASPAVYFAVFQRFALYKSEHSPYFLDSGDSRKNSRVARLLRRAEHFRISRLPAWNGLRLRGRRNYGTRDTEHLARRFWEPPAWMRSAPAERLGKTNLRIYNHAQKIEFAGKHIQFPVFADYEGQGAANLVFSDKIRNFQPKTSGFFGFFVCFGRAGFINMFVF